MSTDTQLLYKIVFSTKNRAKVLDSENRTKLLKYIRNSATPFGVEDIGLNFRRLKPTAIHVMPYRARNA